MVPDAIERSQAFTAVALGKYLVLTRAVVRLQLMKFQLTLVVVADGLCHTAAAVYKAMANSVLPLTVKVEFISFPIETKLDGGWALVE